MSMSDDMRQLGYSKEDEYFFKKDQELIAKFRAEAAAHRQALEEANQDQPYWMICPKCGGQLKEELYRDLVAVDRCGGCKGVYLDRGELEIAVKAQQPVAEV
jgi:hypothetical protein